MPKAGGIGEKGRWLGGEMEKSEDGSGGAGADGKEEEERLEEHSLSWDADGGKLAFGLGRQVRILIFCGALCCDDMTLTTMAST